MRTRTTPNTDIFYAVKMNDKVMAMTNILTDTPKKVISTQAFFNLRYYLRYLYQYVFFKGFVRYIFASLFFSETWKNVFVFTSKALFILEKIKF